MKLENIQENQLVAWRGNEINVEEIKSNLHCFLVFCTPPLLTHAFR